MDLLVGIVLFIVFIVAKSFGDSKKQKAKRQQRTTPSERQPWDTVFQQQTEQPSQNKDLAAEPLAADKDANGMLRTEHEPGRKAAEYQPPHQESAIQLRERKSVPKVRQKRIVRPEVHSVTEVEQPKTKKNSKLAVEEIFDEENIMTAFILSEVLQPPKALKQTRR